MILESCCAAILAGERLAREARNITIDTVWQHLDGPFKNVPVKDFSVAQSLQPLDGVRIDVGGKHLAKVDSEQTSWYPIAKTVSPCCGNNSMSPWPPPSTGRRRNGLIQE